MNLVLVSEASMTIVNRGAAIRIVFIMFLLRVFLI
jgi:hypothetical protein